MKKFMKVLLTSLGCAAILFGGKSLLSQAEESPALPSSFGVSGIVNSVSDGRIHITQINADNNGQDMILNISEDTYILDAVNGDPISLSQIQTEEVIYAYIGPAMTMSLPPITNAKVVFCQIPQDFQTPEFVTIESVTIGADGQSATIIGDNKISYSISDDTQLTPYLTRNIVTVHNLAKGRNCIIWKNGTQTRKLMLLPDRSTPALKTGWVNNENTWYYYDENGALFTGWLLDNGDWYYLNPENGVMQTGFLTLDGKTYYLQGDGRMLTSSKIFMPDSSGVLR